jgi:hypothetical protein
VEKLEFGTMETALHLLMRDGAARVAFHPRLNAEQYADLLARVARATTKEELRREMKEAATLWGSELVFDTEIV